jgi:hypothetical protein
MGREPVLSFAQFIITKSAISSVVEDEVRGLVSTAHRPEGSFVNLPILYPSGSGVVVRISGGPNTYFVTDFGLGYTEADFMGATRIYLRQARGVSESAGVRFDDHAFFAVEVPRDRIAGAIVTIANCSSEAVALTAFKLAEKAKTDASDRLIERLESAFGRNEILHDKKVVGASNHEWEFTAAIQQDGHESLFEFATKHPNSIASVAMKMSDIAHLENAPRRIVMVHNKPELGTYLSVLNRSADVIDEHIGVEQLRRLARAA